MYRRTSRLAAHTPLINTLCGVVMIVFGVALGWFMATSIRSVLGPGPGPAPVGPAAGGSRPFPWFVFAMPAFQILIGGFLIAYWAPAIRPRMTRAIQVERLSGHARVHLRGKLTRRANRRLHWYLLRTSGGPARRVVIGLGLVYAALTVDRSGPEILPRDASMYATFGVQFAVMFALIAALGPMNISVDAFLRRRFSGHCPRCAYDTGSRGITACPECGQAMGGPRPDRPPRRQSARSGRRSVRKSRPS